MYQLFGSPEFCLALELNQTPRFSLVDMGQVEAVLEAVPMERPFACQPAHQHYSNQLMISLAQPLHISTRLKAIETSCDV